MRFQEGLGLFFFFCGGGGAHVECAERGIRHGDTALDDQLDRGVRRGSDYSDQMYCGWINYMTKGYGHLNMKFIGDYWISYTEANPNKRRSPDHLLTAAYCMLFIHTRL